MPSHEASLRNLKKARAAWSHPPRPWRSAHESRVIKRLVWQWFNSKEPEKWSGRAVAHWLGVTHTYIQKLVREFASDSSEMQRESRYYGPVSFRELGKAQEETRQEKERGWLRSPRRWKVTEFKIGDEVVRVVVSTKAEERRKAEKASPRRLTPLYVAPHSLPLWARGLPYYSPDNPCDPLIAVRHAMEEEIRPRPFSFRLRKRWRLG